MQPLLLTGGGIRLVINGSVVGFATSIQVSRSVNTKPIYELDSQIPAEIMTTNYAVSGSLQGIRMRNISLDALGIMNASSPEAILAQKYCTIEIVDRVTNKTMYTIRNVLFDGESFSIQNKAIMSFSASFKGIFMFTAESNS